MNFNEDTVKEYSDMVKQISYEYRRRYSMVDVLDIQQEMWLWFASHTTKLETWKAEEDEKSVIKLVAKSLRNCAYDFCIKEKAHKEGYSLSDVFFYRKEFIKTLLPAVVLDDWTKAQSALSLGTKKPTVLAEANDWMAYLADIKKALDSLPDNEKEIVIEFYGNEATGSDIHEKIIPHKTTARAASMQANRALNKMVKFLGGFPPFKDKND